VEKDHTRRPELCPSVSSAWLGAHRANTHTDEAKYVAPPANNNNTIFITRNGMLP